MRKLKNSEEYTFEMDNKKTLNDNNMNEDETYLEDLESTNKEFDWSDSEGEEEDDFIEEKLIPENGKKPKINSVPNILEFENDRKGQSKLFNFWKNNK